MFAVDSYWYEANSISFTSWCTARRLDGGAVCGSGNIYSPEEWDDKNLTDGDGCSSTCKIEPGFTWSGEPSIWKKCGNGKIEGTERCDDANTSSGDGWNNLWIVESGWIWNGAVLSVCQKWGDRNIQGTEVCDDGNKVCLLDLNHIY